MQVLIAHKGLLFNADLSKLVPQLFPLCRSFLVRRQEFNRLHYCNKHSWALRISAFAKKGQTKEAISLYHKLRNFKQDIDAYTYVTVLNACARAVSLGQGKLIHGHIAESSFQANLFVGNALVDMYSKCQSLKDARRVFDTLPERDVVTWNTMISGYVQHECAEEALHIFEQMLMEGVTPNSITIVSALKACGTNMAIDLGRLIHCQLIESGADINVYIGSSLIDMYVKFGLLVEARDVFSMLHEHNTVSWTTMIAGYIQHGLDEEALELFERMQEEGVKPNKVTYVTMLRLCCNKRALSYGRFLHSQLDNCGIKLDLVLGSTLVDMYAKCGDLAQAHKVFKSLEHRNVISWNILIAGYVQRGLYRESLDLFQQMQEEGFQPDHVTYVSVLKANGNMGSLDCGKLLHNELKKVSLEVDLYLRSALIDMYAKCGSLVEAVKLFNSSLERNVVLWSAMISGYIHNGDGFEALRLFRQMKEEGLKPDKVTFLSIFKACSIVAALYEGEQLHAELVESGFEPDVLFGNALIDMYCKCGGLYMAHKVFDELADRNVVTWTSLIAGYSHHGKAREALQLFGQMQHDYIVPNDLTLGSILSACRHTGLLDIRDHVSLQT